jgi:hypothetical protein
VRVLLFRRNLHGFAVRAAGWRKGAETNASGKNKPFPVQQRIMR